jgi:hypothetical protein
MIEQWRIFYNRVKKRRVGEKLAEPAIVFGQMLSNLVHLQCLVHRTRNEKYFFSHKKRLIKRLDIKSRTK